VLGLTSTASALEIKTRFRQLVVQYHPDKNSSPGAASRIREINEAYDVLGDPNKKIQYDYRRSNLVFQQQSTPVHRDPAYHRARTHRRPTVSSQYLMMQQCMPFVTKLIYFALVFCAFLTLDFVLPRKVQEEIVVDKRSHIARTRGRSYHSSDIIYTNKGTTFEIDLESTGPLTDGKVIFVSYTRIQNIPIRVADGVFFSVRVPVTIFGNFIFAPIILLILSLLGYYFRKNVNMAFNLGTTIFFILLLCIYFLKIS
jgi:hypothetical protein